MVSRRIAVALTLVFAAASAGCANGGYDAGGPQQMPSDVVVAPVSPSSPASAPASPGGETISGTVTAGVEPGCMLVQDAKGPHLLVFNNNASLREQAKVGAKVTVTGRSAPDQMSTCQQGVPFLVESVSAG